MGALEGNQMEVELELVVELVVEEKVVVVVVGCVLLLVVVEEGMVEAVVAVVEVEVMHCLLMAMASIPTVQQVVPTGAAAAWAAGRRHRRVWMARGAMQGSPSSY